MYASEDEFQYRFGQWMQQDDVIAQLNYYDPLATYGHNKFSDLSPQEKARYTGLD